MKKIIFLGVVLILVVAGAAPFINGLLLDRTVHHAFDDLNAIYADSGTDISIELVSYNRNLLSTDIEWKINFGSLKTAYGIEEIVFVDHAKHGYTGVVSTTNLDKNPWFASLITNKLQGKNPFHISTIYSLFGNIEVTLATDAFSLNVEKEVLDVHQGRFVISSDYNLKHFISSGKWQGLTVAEKFSIGETSMESDLEMISTYLWDGDFTYDIRNINAKAPEGQFTLEDLKGKYTLKVDQEKNALSGEATFTIGSLDAVDVTVDSASARVAVIGMNAKGYEEYMKMYAEIMSEFLPYLKTLEAEPEKAKELIENEIATIGFQMIAALEKLLQKGLEFQVSDLLIKLPTGNITGEITLRLLKEMTLMQFAPVVGQPDLMLDIFYLKSGLSLPANLAGENPLLLSPPYPGMKTGIFVKQGDNLTHKAETRDGKLFVNDEEVILTQ